MKIDEPELEERVVDFICSEKCGTDFDKPGSCEDCANDERMRQLFEYEIKQAKEQGEKYFG